MRGWLLAFLIALVASIALAPEILVAQEGSEPKERSDIRIPITDGRIHWRDLCDQPFFATMPMAEELKGLAKAQVGSDAYVPADLVIMLLKLSGSKATVQYKEKTEDPVAIVVDREYVTAQSDAWKLAMFRAIGDANSGGINGIIPVPDTWDHTSDGSNADRIVVVLAGYRSRHATSAEFAKSLGKETGLPIAVYFYPTSVDLQTNIDQFQTMLREFAQTKPNSHITLVGHSMGSIVARGAMECNPELSPSAVDQLIQIFPPNHGSVLAELTEATEAAQLLGSSAGGLAGLINPMKVFAMSAGSKFDLFMGVALNGFGAASRDMRPDSEFLKEFNELTRNPKVSYSILAGSEGPMPRLFSFLHGLHEGELKAMQAKADPMTRALMTQVTRYAQADELKAGLGDGVVTLKSARLDGVSDYKQVFANHFEWYRTDTTGGKSVLKATVARIKQMP